MAVHQKQFHGKKTLLPGWKEGLVLLLGLLVVVALFYGMHRYFEYRNRELDKRLERLQ